MQNWWNRYRRWRADHRGIRIAKRLNPPLVEASIEFAAAASIVNVITEEMGNAGWQVIRDSIGPNRHGIHRWNLIGRVLNGGADPLAIAEDQLLARFAETRVFSLSMEAHRPASARLGLWRPVFADNVELTGDEHRGRDQLARNHRIIGDFSQVKEEWERIYRHEGLDPTIVQWVAGNPYASAAHVPRKNRRPFRELIIGGVVLAASIILGLAAGTSGSPVSFFVANGKPAPWLFPAVFAPAGAVAVLSIVVVAAIELRKRKRKALSPVRGRLERILLASFLCATAVLGFIMSAVFAANLGIAGTLLMIATASVVICALQWVATRFTEAVRFGANRGADLVLLGAFGVTMLVILLNLPSATFLVLAGVPQLIGSIPVGAMLWSWGLAAIFGMTLLAVLGTLTVRAVRSGASDTFPPLGMLVGFFGLVLLLAALAVPAGDGLRVRAGSEPTNQSQVAAVCVQAWGDKEPKPYWFLGESGSTIYIIARATNTHGEEASEKPADESGSPIMVSGTTAITFAGSEDTCQRVQ
ncbi:hypothetical protein ACWKWP_04310 [Agromyces soli]